MKLEILAGADKVSDAFMIWQDAMNEFSRLMMEIHKGQIPNTEENRMKLWEARRKLTNIFFESLEWRAKN